jgi:hypothetical protein
MKNKITQSKTDKYFSEKMFNSLIQKVEDAITVLTIEREQIADELERRKKAYFEVKGHDDSLVTKIEEENQALEALIRLKTNGGTNKTVKVYKSISNSTINKPVKKKIPWLKEIESLLEKEQKFYVAESLFDKVELDNPSFRFPDKRLRHKFIQYYFINGMKAGKHKSFKMHNGKVGLSHWFFGDTIKERYLSSFLPHNC